MTIHQGKRSSSAARVSAWRRRMRRKGLREMHMWVPDTTSEAFRRRAASDARAVAASPTEAADQAFVDAISIFDDSDEAR